jgi:hypothetical protein
VGCQELDQLCGDKWIILESISLERHGWRYPKNKMQAQKMDDLVWAILSTPLQGSAGVIHIHFALPVMTWNAFLMPDFACVRCFVQLSINPQ